MRTLTVTREAVCATASTWTKLTGDGAGGTLQDSTVPVWARSIKCIAMGIGIDGAAVSQVYGVKLTGATQYGDQILTMGAGTNIGTTVGLAQAQMKKDVGIPVTPGKALEIYASLHGTTSGNPEVQVEITYSDESANYAYVSRCDALATVDTWQTMDLEFTATTVSDSLTIGKSIVQTWAAVALSPTTQQPHQVSYRLQGIAGSISDNEHTFTTNSNMVSDGTLADSCIDPCKLNDVAIAVTPGTLRIQGVDSSAASTADPICAVTVCFEM